MIGYLIYDVEGKERNEWFINELILNAKIKGVTLKLVLDSEYKNLPLPNFAIVRCINPLINKYYEKCGITVFNSSLVSKTANDKYETYLLSKKLDIPVMETCLLKDFSVENFGKMPYVVKKRAGHGGKQVYLIKSIKDFENLNIINKDEYIVQKVADTLGVDTRVYLLGGKEILAVKRSSESDFRSNFSLGGRAEVVKSSDSQSKIIGKLLKNLQPSFIGIDFIFDNGEWVLNEIEDPVGSRMIYETSKINVAKEYINYVIGELKK